MRLPCNKWRKDLANGAIGDKKKPVWDDDLQEWGKSSKFAGWNCVFGGVSGTSGGCLRSVSGVFREQGKI